MAHNIQERDSQHGLTMAWHQMTQIPQEGILRRDEVFPYQIKKDQLFREGGATEHGEWFTPACSDDNLPVGNGPCLNEGSYTLLPPQDVWDMLGELMEGTKHEIVSAGSVANRSRYFITLKLEELDTIEIGGRKFNIFLNAISSMDRTIPLVITNTSICTVCENTLLANFLSESLFKHKLKHTSNLKEKIELMKELLEETFGVAAQFKKAMSELDSVKCTETTAERIFTGALAADDAEKKIPVSRKMATRLKNQVDRYVEVYKEGLGNKGETMLDVLSSYTELNTRTDEPGKVARFRQRDLDITANGVPTKKARFASSLLDSNSRDSLAQRGQNLQNLLPV